MKLFRTLKLRTKIFWLVSLNIFLATILVASIISYFIAEQAIQEAGERALLVSKTVAALPEVIRAFRDPDPARRIQPIAEKFRIRTGAEFIVVGNMKALRYSHPNPDNIGLRMVGEDNEAVLKGIESITRAKGTLGFSIRGKAPILDPDRRQIGLVSTGFLVQNIRSSLYPVLMKITLICLIALLIGLSGAYLLARHIKSQLFNMEPSEIAFTTQEQTAILEAIREGIVAVNSQGLIVSCNREAKKMLGREDQNLIGTAVTSILPETRLPEVLKDGLPQYDQPTVVGNTLVIANRVPVVLSGRVIGAVATFRDSLQLAGLDKRMADISRYIDTLRSQRHEFMNKLHLISGLIKMSEYEAAREVIEEVNETYQQTMEFYLARIHDSAIVGLLIGKTHAADELGIQLTISPESSLSERCPHREIVVAILGNTIENAFEAIRLAPLKIAHPVVTVYIKEETEDLHLWVRDNGPGVDPAVKDRLFEDGVTTKGKDRGFGLAFISRLVTNAGGTVTGDSFPDGTLIKVILPKEGRLG